MPTVEHKHKGSSNGDSRVVLSREDHNLGYFVCLDCKTGSYGPAWHRKGCPLEPGGYSTMLYVIGERQLPGIVSEMIMDTAEPILYRGPDVDWGGTIGVVKGEVKNFHGFKRVCDGGYLTLDDICQDSPFMRRTHKK